MEENIATVREALVQLEGKMTIARTVEDRRRLADLARDLFASGLKLKLDLQYFSSVPPSTFDSFWINDIMVDSKIRTECGIIYGSYCKTMTEGKYEPLSNVKFSRQLSVKGIVSKQSNGIRYYPGIRIRTVDDPHPKFPYEISPSPDPIQKIRHAFLSIFFVVDEKSENSQLVNGWIWKHYESCDMMSSIIELDVVHVRFGHDTGSFLPKEDFLASTTAKAYISYPTELRWKLTPEGNIPNDPKSDAKHCFEESKRVWLALKEIKA